MTDLYQRSIEIILENQSANGGYIASPNFPTYHYCWFRDGSFIAYAMDVAGQHESARRFHQCVSERVNERKHLVRRGLTKARSGEKFRRPKSCTHAIVFMEQMEGRTIGPTSSWMDLEHGFGHSMNIRRKIPNWDFRRRSWMPL